MKRLILLELVLLFLATTFPSHNPPGWYQIAMPNNDQITDIYFTDSLKGWYVTPGNTGGNDTAYIVYTSNGGTNWVVQFGEALDLKCIQFVNEDTGYAGGGSGSGTRYLYKTTNGGNNWSRILGTFGTGISVASLFFVNANTGWITDASTLDGGLFKTTNGGVNWQVQLNQTFTPSKLFFLNQDTGWAVCNNSKIYKTVNGGINWTLLFSHSNAVVSIQFLNNNTGWFVGGGSTKIYKTINAGINWSAQANPGLFGTPNISLGDSNRLWIGNALNTMLATSNGGTNWGYQQTSTITNYTVFFPDLVHGYGGTVALIKTDDGGGVITGINSQGEVIVSEYKLGQNYPNPFNPLTRINYELKITNYVSIKVYDLTGKETVVLVNEKKNAGSYSVSFDAGKYNLSSGIYFYSLEIAGVVKDTKKMILVK